MRRPIESVRRGTLFLGLSGLLLAVSGWVVFDELVIRRPWKQQRQALNRLLVDRGLSPLAVALEQTSNPELAIVDRCTSCHGGIDQAGLEDAPQPHRTHPQRGALFGANHPPHRFGCVVCHHGQGRQTKGVAHRPFAHGLNDPYWERPLLPGSLVQSTCLRCHAPEALPDEADQLRRGQALFEDLRCYGCHASSYFSTDRPAGPPLTGVRAKFSYDFAVEWIRSPQSIRPRTRMPDHWPPPLDVEGAPAPEDTPKHRAWVRARKEEPRAIAAFLGSLSTELSRAAPEGHSTPVGDAERGRATYILRGCPVCHETSEGEDRPLGPELLRIGDKASKAWLAAWLGGPKTVWAKAEMPDLRLTDIERQDLVAYLSSLRTPNEQSSTPWPGDSVLIAEGRQLVERYGCYGCHDLRGFSRGARGGPDLTGFGAKTPDLLEWGDGDLPRGEAPLPVWTRIKIAQPRRLTRAGIDLVMPTNHLSPQDVEALTIFVLSDREDSVPEAYRAPVSKARRVRARGERILSRYGCRKCHEVGRDEKRILDEDGELLFVDYVPHGGDIRKFYDRPGLMPPSLTFAGSKFQYPWLYAYLGRPTAIRPWLPAQMPTFDLTSEERSALVAYFAFENGEHYPFKEGWRGSERPPSPSERDDAVWLFTEMQCLKCHQLSTSGSDVAERAPDLALAAERLSGPWIRDFLLTPQRLQPGTRMPSLFPLFDDDVPDSYTTPYPERLGGDVHRQVRALLELTLRLGRDPDLAGRIRRSSESR